MVKIMGVIRLNLSRLYTGDPDIGLGALIQSLDIAETLHPIKIIYELGFFNTHGKSLEIYHFEKTLY